MEIIPAVDLRNGKCVRLYQGDYDMETVFSDEPLEMAMKWQSLGATRLHVVDLDAAASGELRNLKTVTQIASALLIPVQVGGGIRQMETIERLFKLGVDRVVLGTAAVENPELVGEACRRFGQSVIIGIDTREGSLAIHGWRQETELGTIEFARSMVNLGVKRFIYTDIGRDGTLTEPNFSAIFELVDDTRFPVIASGGISSLIHLRVLKKLGVEGAIVGKALYTGDINLKQALDVIG
ncbi:MAG: 1-(5-phosphoribosyl)-5-[(5-phosphoribosylamino)methylideneamino]imidazole-4-carboxamide isomerase [Dehalococcoidales bacterium]